MSTKKDLLAIYASAISAVEGKYVVAEALPSILEQQLSLGEINQLEIIAIGKAADSMLQGAISCLDNLDVKPTTSLLISNWALVLLIVNNTRVMDIIIFNKCVIDSNL